MLVELLVDRMPGGRFLMIVRPRAERASTAGFIRDLRLERTLDVHTAL